MCGRNGLVFLLLIIPGWAFPQSKQLTLKEIDNNSQLYQQEAEVRIFNYLKANPQERIVYFNGGVRILTDVTESGIPLYTKTFNATEAITLNIQALRNSSNYPAGQAPAGTGSLGINILGTGIRLGTWDGGRVLANHVELVGRVTQLDNPTENSDHATHTTGTMMATGINADAKGMAPEATLVAYDFTNDVTEMISQAKPDQTTLLLSNHSYGSVCGWDNSGGGAPVWRGDVSISTTTDYRLVFYDSRAAQYDAIAYNAPYYTIVKAAGNDRGESGGGPQGPDGGVNGFDCIPTESVAKNIITVGAVQNVANYTQPSDVLMTSFSSWGPTDDGRIKPDIVAPGFNVFSLNATSNTGYEIESGTSMSTPAATGTLALLQQLYKNLNSGNYMRSATVKGLIIHTAREAGASPGPDYSYGWGLLDAKAAASLIINKDNQNIFIREASLANGQTYELDLGTPKTGTKIKATLVWTDPAGTSPAPALNPTNKMLVNDLDLRLVDDGSNTQLPWTLNPASPSLAAVAGDNVRDNVEKIELNSTSPRGYKLRVTNKGTLVGTTQSFSLILEYSSQVDPRTTYYWKPVLSTLPGPGSVLSGGGKWTDPGHWSLTSGGPSANVVPGPDDRVVFDENSFANDPDTIVVKVPNSSQSCYSLRWFAKEAVDMSFNGNTLSIGEGMTLLTNKITTSTTGTISFTSAATVANSVDLSENLLNKWSLMFNGASTWSVTGSASIDNINLSQGTVEFNGAALHLNQLSPLGTAAKAVSFTSSSLQALQGLSIDFTGITVQSDILSSIIASPSSTNTLNLSAANFQGFISLANGDITVTGSNTVRSIQGNGIARLNGSFLVSNVNLTGGSQLVLQQGTTTTFTDKFVLSTSAASRAKILSSGPMPRSRSPTTLRSVLITPMLQTWMFPVRR
ncbi:MAG: S8 family serine peptidase [Bacteroidota bacterium]